MKRHARFLSTAVRRIFRASWEARDRTGVIASPTGGRLEIVRSVHNRLAEYQPGQTDSDRPKRQRQKNPKDHAY